MKPLFLSDYTGFFFDFDGLLVNTEHLHFEAYKQILTHYGFPFIWDFLTFCSIAHQSSEGLRHVITAHAPTLIKEKGWETFYLEKQETYQILLETTQLYLMPGAAKMLEIVEKMKKPFCVVTNSTIKQVEKVKTCLPSLKKIPLWITREDYLKAKPAPDSYLKAIQLLQIEGKKLGFEDSLRGIRALQKAKIDPILICPSDHPQMEEAKKENLCHFTSFEALLDRITF